MITFIKIVFLLGFLILIHEAGHFIVAKKLGVTINEFSIGFGPKIFSKEKDKTQYELRLIPIGGFVSLEGEEEHSDKEGSFNKASKKMQFLIIIAGAMVNIIFGMLAFLILILVRYMINIDNNFFQALGYSFETLKELMIEFVKSFASIFTGKLNISDMTGPIGISSMVSKTSNITEFVYLLSIISISLGFTNLLPILPLDGGKAIIIIIEAIIKRPLKQRATEILSTVGLALIMTLSIFCMVNDISRLN